MKITFDVRSVLTAGRGWEKMKGIFAVTFFLLRKMSENFFEKAMRGKKENFLFYI